MGGLLSDYWQDGEQDSGGSARLGGVGIGSQFGDLRPGDCRSEANPNLAPQLPSGPERIL